MCSEINRGVKRRDQFQHFDFTSRKSRRLDCQLTPRYEEEAVNREVERKLLLDPSVTGCAAVHSGDVPITDVMPLAELSGDRALALFQPAGLLRSPSSPRLEIKVHPDLVDDLRNYRYQITSAYTPEVKDQLPNYPSASSNLAVIPWVNYNITEQSKSMQEPMEADSDLEMMDTEDFNDSTISSEGLQQPQHCLLPHTSQCASSQVLW